jgi:hypothetical protein
VKINGCYGGCLGHHYISGIFGAPVRGRSRQAALAKKKQQVKELHSDEAEELTRSLQCRII